MSFKTNPWASGPGEILNHGLALLKKKDSDVNRRIALISIDNSVELMMKTYLNLPRRITGLSIGRKKFIDISESFPRLLDAMEEFAEDKITDINLGEIEWYHRLRNELYHQGNGLTVELEKVETYGKLARLLFNNLFGFEIFERNQKNEIFSLEVFFKFWGELEKSIRNLNVLEEKNVVYTSNPNPRHILKELEKNKIISTEELNKLDNYRNYRNQLAHAIIKPEEIPPEIIDEYEKVISNVISKIESIKTTKHNTV